jgi:hypothetical protein
MLAAALRVGTVQANTFAHVCASYDSRKRTRFDLPRFCPAAYPSPLLFSCFSMLANVLENGLNGAPLDDSAASTMPECLRVVPATSGASYASLFSSPLPNVCSDVWSPSLSAKPVGDVGVGRTTGSLSCICCGSSSSEEESAW